MPPKRKKAIKQKQKQNQRQSVIVNIGSKTRSKTSGRGKLPPPSYQQNLAPIVLPQQQQIDYTPLLLSMMQQQSKVPIQTTTQPPVNNIVPPSPSTAAAEAALRRAGQTASNFQSRPSSVEFSTQTSAGDMEAIQTSRKTQTDSPPGGGSLRQETQHSKTVKDTEATQKIPSSRAIIRATEATLKQFSNERAKKAEQLEVRDPDEYITERLVTDKPDPLSRSVSDITDKPGTLSRSVSDISQASTIATTPGFVASIPSGSAASMSSGSAEDITAQVLPSETKKKVDKMNKAELQQEAIKLNIDASGTKQKLIRAIERARNEPGAGGGDPPIVIPSSVRPTLAASMSSGSAEDITNTPEYNALKGLTYPELQPIARELGLSQHTPRKVEGYRRNIVKKQLELKKK